jgi:hypothetical protein
MIILNRQLSVDGKQDAHYQPGEAIIRYRFHPRCGETVIVTGRKRHGDEVALIVRQPDGTLAHLPIWMTEDRAAAMTVTKTPRLTLECLRDLRLELDAWQSLLRDDSRREGDEHAAPAAQSSPTRSLRAQRSASADRRVRADDAVAAGKYPPGGDAGCRR